MRTGAALMVVAAALVGLVLLLMREGTQLWHLAAVGTAAGTLSGGIWRGRLGTLVGGVAGCVAGFVAPLLYLPFWLVFTLPPHPRVDL